MATDSISLQGMRFHTCVGLLPHEEHLPQPLELDLRVGLDLQRVGESDEPSMRVDYRDLYALVEKTVGSSPHRLLEALCEQVADRALELPEVDEVEVAARKPHAPIPGPLDHVEVRIIRRR
ncbi:MAG: dihydroneopterin aldolase [Acidobacteriota bacterium]